MERERDTLRRRLNELETEYGAMNQGHFHTNVQTMEMGIQKDSYRTTHRPTLEQSRLTGLHGNSQHFQNSYRVEDNDNPLRKLEALEREIKELRDHREHQVLGIHARSGGKGIKAHSSSPRFERDKHSSRIDDIETSPQFNPYAAKGSDELMELERQKRNLKNELKQMIGLDESKIEYSRRIEESFSILKTSEAHKDHFENIMDKYTDKMLRESGPYNETKELPSAGKLKYEDFAPSGTKGEQPKKSQGIISSNHEVSSRGRDIFKIDSPSPIQKQENKPKYDIEELSQKSNRSLVESFSEDHPKPIIFKKEVAPSKF